MNAYLLTEKNFRRSVPHGDDFVSVNADRNGNSAGEAKISKFDVARFVDQKILWLQITMEYSTTMAK